MTTREQRTAPNPCIHHMHAPTTSMHPPHACAHESHCELTSQSAAKRLAANPPLLLQQ